MYISSDLKPLRFILDLETFAEEWERSGKGKKAIALQDIRKELCYPWKEVRVSYTDLNPDELFYLLTGETEQTLKEGMLVIARVVRILPRVLTASRCCFFCNLKLINLPFIGYLL